jgi:5-methylcytosine-specific restriction endonuclease McrA
MPKCSICKSNLNLVEKDYFNVYVCNTCNLNQIPTPLKTCCREPDLSFVRFITCNGCIQVRRQCLNCGLLEGRSFPHKDHDVDSLPVADLERDKLYHERYTDQSAELHANRASKRYLAKMPKQEMGDYDWYIGSNTWKLKRQRVLERDNYICQSCLQNKAEEVHHLTYIHLSNEPLFELVSVCKTCHEAITLMDKERDFSLRIPNSVRAVRRSVTYNGK